MVFLPSENTRYKINNFKMLESGFIAVKAMSLVMTLHLHYLKNKANQMYEWERVALQSQFLLPVFLILPTYSPALSRTILVHKVEVKKKKKIPPKR